MRLIPDTTGRFLRRPYYSYSELDRIMERIAIRSATKRHGRMVYPISTDDLTVLIEGYADDLDLFHDFPAEEADVDGMTEFIPGRKPRVKIARRLSTGPNENRLRSTLGHEVVHLVVHRRVYDKYAIVPAEQQNASAYLCRQANLANDTCDWMELQARYGSAALLIPSRALQRRLCAFEQRERISGPFIERSMAAQDFTHLVADAFQTSRQCAELRLRESGIIQTPLPRRELERIASVQVNGGLQHCGPLIRVLVAQHGIPIHQNAETSESRPMRGI